MSLAGEGELLVTSTTKELVTGSGFGFEDLSAHELKGVPGTWQVFAVTSVDEQPRAEALPAPEAAERRRAILPPSDRGRPRPAAWIAGVTAAAAAIVMIALVAGRDGRVRPSANRERPAQLSEAVVEVNPERDPPIVRSIRLPVERHGAGGIAPPVAAHPIVVGQGGVWSVRFRSLFHVDPSRSEVRERITLEAPISFAFTLAEGADKIWISFDGGVIEVNPATDDQRRVISLPSLSLSAADITFGGRFVWVGLGNGRLIRFDPRTGRDVTRTELAPINAIAFGHGSVWALDVVGEALWRYDPETMEQVAQVQVGEGDRIVVGDAAVWVLSRTLGTLTRIDPRTNDRTGVVQVGPTPTGLAAGSGAIWVGDEDGVIRRVDEGTRQVTMIPFGAEVRGIAYDDETDNLWVDVF
jgi:streptogramin lyase